MQIKYRVKENLKLTEERLDVAKAETNMVKRNLWLWMKNSKLHELHHELNDIQLDVMGLESHKDFLQRYTSMSLYNYV